MTWNWDPDLNVIEQPGEPLKGRVLHRSMDRDQQYMPAGVFLYEPDFAVVVSLSLATDKGDDGGDDGVLLVKCGGFGPTRHKHQARDLPVSEGFQTLAHQRRYLAALTEMVAILPVSIFRAPGETEPEGPVRLIPPVFKGGHWSPYSTFLLTDPGG